jgi:hypothetical protein
MHTYQLYTGVYEQQGVHATEITISSSISDRSVPLAERYDLSYCACTRFCSERATKEAHIYDKVGECGNCREWLAKLMLRSYRAK